MQLLSGNLTLCVSPISNHYTNYGKVDIVFMCSEGDMTRLQATKSPEALPRESPDK